MRYVYLALSALLLAAWMYIGSTPGVGGAPLPAMGKFFNPSEGFWQNGKQRLVSRSENRSVAVDNALARGNVFFDERGVPHIFAEDLASASFLQGYVNAADRLWQMDISTRATEGRLSEILGA
ncbi:MAG: penicillin acylase family protein, partial [Bacteroidota bacterium]